MSLRTLGWAAYLAVSWTWCIGMFFPVLLVRDYGIWGFVVFAAPNVIGAAAMGWILSRDGMSEALVERHRPAMVAFSVVTAAFHGYWLLWLAHSVLRLDAAYGVFVLVLLGSIITHLHPAMRNTGRWRWWSAAGTLVLSAALVVWPGGGIELGWPEPAEGFGDGLWPLVFPSLLGFALCPYLDLTFHRARREMRPAEAKVGFTLGFAVFFFGMILLTLAYSGAVAGMLTPGAVVASGTGMLAMHIGLQAFHTTQYHTEEVRRADSSPRPPALVAWALAIGGALVILPVVLGSDPIHAGMSVGELVYRSFMVFYGLVFPAYVWISMIPKGGGHASIFGFRGRRNRLVLAGIIGLALPFYWMGFIERQEPWLIPGVAIVLLGRLFAGRSSMSREVAASN